MNENHWYTTAIQRFIHSSNKRYAFITVNNVHLKGKYTKTFTLVVLLIDDGPLHNYRWFIVLLHEQNRSLFIIILKTF